MTFDYLIIVLVLYEFQIYRVPNLPTKTNTCMNQKYIRKHDIYFDLHDNYSHQGALVNVR